MDVIDVAIVTWPNIPKRLDYFKMTIESVKTHLTASRHELRFYCSAESERDPHPKAEWCGPQLIELCEEHGIELQWRGCPANLGANMNAAMKMGTGRFVYLQQDDWRLDYPLDLSAGAEILAAYHPVDMIRYNWPVGEGMTPIMRESKIVGWRRIDTRGPWPYGDDPHLRRRDFMDDWGWYIEGGLHGSASGGLMKAMRKKPAYILAADKPYCGHCGWASSNITDARGGNDRRYAE